MNKFFKLITAFLTLTFLVTTTAPSVAYAATQNNIQNTQSNSAVQEQQLTEAIQYIFDHAATYNKQGYIENIDFDLIRSQYGDSQELTLVENDVNADLMYKASAWQCTVTAIQDTLGVAAISSLLSGGIVGLVQRKAAAEIAKLILKVGIKNVAPAAAAASLIWSFGRCMWF
ncbi:hypothetical protein MCPGFBBE_00451 [Streptococcus equi subsp. zooepidemicus]|uniref:hypothetical protein n=1 Tax=Streptococcus equi TaxID=1336 RepID=UPI00197FD414|nr:hypothetical protein [Streptococcus equi]QTZ58351.1 hypothetical protein MCPGFBBE_00451 [Streptococcus equi subsp. zooepidemicus]